MDPKIVQSLLWGPQKGIPNVGKPPTMIVWLELECSLDLQGRHIAGLPGKAHLLACAAQQNLFP